MAILERDPELEEALSVVFNAFVETGNERLCHQATYAWASEDFDFDLWLAWTEENLEHCWNVPGEG